jgi:hypothetical protein
MTLYKNWRLANHTKQLPEHTESFIAIMWLPRSALHLGPNAQLRRS